jgi:hypothetical protein
MHHAGVVVDKEHSSLFTPFLSCPLAKHDSRQSRPNWESP